MSDVEVFVWGAIGGLVAFSVTLVLPNLLLALRMNTAPNVPRWKVLLYSVLVAFMLGLGGLSALIADATRTRDAVVYGMAWESILGGVINSGRARTDPR